ncbi:MAG TPA: DegT/DnrJ/EryC1/StrS family aminotransferase [Gemmatimonadaceae bacterium]|nr:DegT/DnrJ/EryC1/StrS family aminotransferase [Gemmatimonadaceae bacterium]
MIGRHQLPVSSPISARTLARGAAAALRGGHLVLQGLTSDLRERFGASAVALTDSGTSALVLALRLTVGAGGTVAYPAYGCVDLAAAAEFARVRVRLYDLDPATLSPDLSSLEAALRRGVDAVVATHLYGYPADVPGVAVLADRAGVPVIEDAAQGAAGTLGGTLLGAFGPFTVLSFGRGKGLTGGAGGALLAIGESAAARIEAARVNGGGRGFRELAACTAQWTLGRPAVYGLPSALPWLRLGEMVYHPAHEPRGLAASAAAMVRAALRDADAAAARRRARATRLLDPAPAGVITSIPGGASGMLRVPVRVRPDGDPPTRLGVVPAYPRTLFEQPELGPLLHAGETEHPGAGTLRALLHTVPVHDFVTASDLQAIRMWLRARDSSH